MRISNKVKRLIGLMKMLPNYTFSKAHQGVIHSYINVYVSDSYDNSERYLGELFLYLLPVHTSKSKTYTLFGVPIPQDFNFVEKVLNEWESIGIHHRPCESHASDNGYIYYELWVENDE